MSEKRGFSVNIVTALLNHIKIITHFIKNNKLLLHLAIFSLFVIFFFTLESSITSASHFYSYPTPFYSYPYPYPTPFYSYPYPYPTPFYGYPYPTPYVTPYPTPYVYPYPTPYVTPYPTPYVYPYPTPYAYPYPTPTCSSTGCNQCLFGSNCLGCFTTDPVCLSGETNCGCPPACTNECTSSQCSGDLVRTCGNFDSDSCLELGSPTSCGSSAFCFNGACSSCSSGFANCNNQQLGCEINLNTNSNNCGTCGNVCPSGQCSAGSCVPVCGGLNQDCCGGQFGTCGSGLFCDVDGACSQQCSVSQTCIGSCKATKTFSNCNQATVNDDSCTTGCSFGCSGGSCKVCSFSDSSACTTSQLCSGGSCSNCISGTANCNQAFGCECNLDTNECSGGSCVPSDSTPPTGSVSIKGGATSTTSRFVTLSLSCSDPSGCSHMKISNTFSGLSSASTQSFTTSKSWTLASGDGTKAVFVIYRDSVGNWMIVSSAKSDTIILDTKPPTGSVSINNGAASTSSKTVTLSLSCSDPSGCSEMKITNSLVFSNAAVPFTTSKSWTLTSGDGFKAVSVIYRDSVGNWMPASSAVADTIRLDTKPPTGSVSINNGAASTSSKTVTLSLSCSDPSGCTHMKISNTISGVSSATIQSFTTSKSWTLTSGIGTKAVFVIYRDAVGNWMPANSAVADTIRVESCSGGAPDSFCDVGFDDACEDNSVCPSDCSSADYNSCVSECGSQGKYPLWISSSGSCFCTSLNPCGLSTVCAYDVDLSPKNVDAKGVSKTWTITATDSSSEDCLSAITYDISPLTFPPACASVDVPDKFTVVKTGTTTFDVTLVRNTDVIGSCNVKFLVKDPDGKIVGIV